MGEGGRVLRMTVDRRRGILGQREAAEAKVERKGRNDLRLLSLCIELVCGEMQIELS